MGFEIIKCCTTFEFYPPVLEIIDEWFAFFDQDETLPVLDHYPHDTHEPDRMGEYPLRGCLHPAYTFSFR
jgi:hypothetical protein